MINQFGKVASAVTSAVGLTDDVLAHPTVGFRASVKAPSHDYQPGGTA